MTQKFSPHLQRTNAETAAWGATLIYGNLKDCPDGDLHTLKVLIDDEIDRREQEKQPRPTENRPSSAYCWKPKSDPIHTAQPEQRQNPDWLKEYMETGGVSAQTMSEPERVSDDGLHDVSNLRFYAELFRKHQWQTDVLHWSVFEGTLNQVAERIRTLRAQLADRDNHIATAYAALDGFLGCGCKVSRSIYLFDHIRKLKHQLAEKDAAIARTEGGK